MLTSYLNLKNNKLIIAVLAIIVLYALISTITANAPAPTIPVSIPVETSIPVASATVETVSNSKSIQPFDYSTLGFPYRKLRDENMNTLPIVSITGFFRDSEPKGKYYELRKAGHMVIGVTAYKTFPKRIEDEAEDKFHHQDDFNYVNELQHWLCCFNKNKLTGQDTPFTPNNKLIDISESDFYDNESLTETEKIEKKYDFIYICNKDNDSCPMNGWNAINRNYDLALKCFPIMFNKYKMKGLIVGRVGCGLEAKYGDRVETTDFLDYFVLQQKMRESKFLFVPNIYDASPRVVTECLVKGVPVLMNQNIVCGFKYINEFTGELFSDEHNFEASLLKLLGRLGKIDPRKWWIDNYGRSTTGKKLRNFLLEASEREGYGEITEKLRNINEVHFVL